MDGVNPETTAEINADDPNNADKGGNGDGDPTAEKNIAGGGCGCQQTSDPAIPLVFVLLLLFVLRRRMVRI